MEKSKMYKQVREKVIVIFPFYLLTLIPFLTSCQETLEERGTRDAQNYTEKHCPVTVEKGVVMDSMTFERSTHTFCYSYTLSGAIDDSAVVAHSNLRESLLQQVRNSPNLRIYKEAGYNFRYIYYSTKNRGTKLFDATYRESDYNKQ